MTFDDGFENNYRVAGPVLASMKIPATIFLTTGLIGTDQLLWPDRLFLSLQNTTRDSLDLRKYGSGRFSLVGSAGAMPRGTGCGPC